jgi:hypothetical protein
MDITPLHENNVNKLFMEFQWIPALFKACKEEGLDWLRMAAIVIIKSGGDSSLRIIDWIYLYDTLGPDNPNFLPMYDEDERPTIELIDRATKWGLFQIHGQHAYDMGYKGQAMGLSSVGSSIKLGIIVISKAIEDVEKVIQNLESTGKLEEAANLQNQLPQIAEQTAFDVKPEDINSTVELFKEQLQGLISLE